VCRKCELTWDDVSQQLQQSVAHLDTLDSDAVATMKQSDDARLRHFAQMFDQSRSQAPAVVLAADCLISLTSCDNFL